MSASSLVGSAALGSPLSVPSVQKGSERRDILEQPLIIEPADVPEMLDEQSQGGWNPGDQDGSSTSKNISGQATIAGTELGLVHFITPVDTNLDQSCLSARKGPVDCLTIEIDSEEDSYTPSTEAGSKQSYQVNASTILSDMKEPFEIKPLDQIPDELQLSPKLGFSSAGILDGTGNVEVGNMFMADLLNHDVQQPPPPPISPRRQPMEVLKSFLQRRSTSPAPDLSPGSGPQFSKLASKQHACHLCNYTTKTAWHMEKHLLAHTKVSHTCPYCEKAFERSSDLARHMERHTIYKQRGGERFYTNVSPSNTSPENTTPSPSHKMMFACSSCLAEFTMKELLDEHLKTNHVAAVLRIDEYTCNILTGTQLVRCEVNENNVVKLLAAELDISKAVDEGETIPHVSSVEMGCLVMDQIKREGIADTVTFIQRGIHIQEEEKKQRRSLANRGSLITLGSVTGESEDGVHSPSMSAPREGRMLLTSRHPGHLRPAPSVYTFSCEKCNYTTNMATHYEQHVKAHSGRYVCKMCGKAFIKAADLTRHWVCHETIPGSPYIACDTCSFITLDKKTMEQHMRDHYRILSPDKVLPETAGGSGSGNSNSGSNSAFSDPGQISVILLSLRIYKFVFRSVRTHLI